MLRTLLRSPAAQAGNVVAGLNGKVACDRLGPLWGKVRGSCMVAGPFLSGSKVMRKEMTLYAKIHVDRHTWRMLLVSSLVLFKM